MVAGILLLGSQVDDEVGNVLVAQLLYLANEDAQKDVTLYINSPGGSVSAGMAIFDTMNYVPPDVNTVCFGAPPPPRPPPRAPTPTTPPLLAPRPAGTPLAPLSSSQPSHKGWPCGAGTAASMGAFLLGAGAKVRGRASRLAPSTHT